MNFLIKRKKNSCQAFQSLNITISEIHLLHLMIESLLLNKNEGVVLC